MEDTKGGGMSWKTEVDWLLAGCTIEQVRARADRPRPFWKHTHGRLIAKVRGDRLTARIIRLGRARPSTVLRARLAPESAGVRVRGQIPRSDLTSIVVWVGFLMVVAGLAVTAVAQRSLLDPVTLFFALMAGGLAWVTGKELPLVRAAHRTDLVELEGKVRSRFAGEPTPGAPWVAEPAEGTGFRPFSVQPLIPLGRRRRNGRRHRPGRR